MLTVAHHTYFFFSSGYNTFNETEPANQDLRNQVLHCNVTRVANEYHGNAGISVGYSAGTVLDHNHLEDLTYSGISIGWGWGREKDTCQ